MLNPSHCPAFYSAPNPHTQTHARTQPQPTPARAHPQGPLSRFGDTAANTATLTLLEDVDMPVGLKTVAASLAAGLFRIVLMPVDALKTIMQVPREGGRGGRRAERGSRLRGWGDRQRGQRCCCCWRRGGAAEGQPRCQRSPVG